MSYDNDKRGNWKLNRGDWFTLLLSLVTGIMIWTYVDSRRTEERTVRAPLEIGLPPGWKADAKVTSYARVTLRGPRTIMGALKSDEIRFFRALEIPPGAASNQEVHIELAKEDLRGMPRDVSVVDIPEPAVKFHIVKPVRRYIPVKVQMKGELPKGFEVKSVVCSPEYVAVYAPAEEFSGSDTANTLPVSLVDKTGSFGAYSDLEALKLKTVNVPLEDPIFVQVTLAERPEKLTLEKVPVSILLATPMEKLAGGKLIPPQVTVTVEGGAQAIKALAAGAVTVYIDSKDMGSSVQGEYTMRCRSLAPEGLRVVSIVPEEVRWVIPVTSASPEPAALPVMQPVPAAPAPLPAPVAPLLQESPAAPAASGGVGATPAARAAAGNGARGK